MLDKKSTSSPVHMQSTAQSPTIRMLYENTPKAYKWGYKEALRLNRLYANEYKCYRRAIKKNNAEAPAKLAALQKQIAYLSKKNDAIDELMGMVWYTYDNLNTGSTQQLKKAYVDKLVSKALNADKPQVIHVQLTQAKLQEILYYDAEQGTFEWQEGTRAGKTITFIRNADKAKKDQRKPLRKQHEYRLPLRSRSYKPSEAGYICITQQEYIELKNNPHRAQHEYVHVGKYLKKLNTTMTHVHERYYLVRTKKERGKPAPTIATERVTYYIKSIDGTHANPALQIKILGKSYPVIWLATLYMGAGGDWDYSKGIDNIRKNQEHAMTAPQGLRQYNYITNKAMNTKPRDGDWYNLKWDNIKPEHADHTTINTMYIPKDPTALERPMQLIRKQYNYTRNIQKVYPAYDQMNPRYILVRMGGETFIGWTYEDAVSEFDRRIDKMKGTKQKLRNGDVMVSAMQRAKR